MYGGSGAVEGPTVTGPSASVPYTEWELSGDKFKSVFGVCVGGWGLTVQDYPGHLAVASAGAHKSGRLQGTLLGLPWRVGGRYRRT